MEYKPRKKSTRPKPSCKAKAVDLLARSDQSKNRLRQKLLHAKYSEDEIEEVIEWLEGKHYINEEEGCQRRFQYLYEAENCSVRQICVKLMQQGYERDMIEDCIPSDTSEHEYKAAYRLASAKYKPDMDPRKLIQYLYTKGFPYEEAQRAVSHIIDDDM